MEGRCPILLSTAVLPLIGLSHPNTLDQEVTYAPHEPITEQAKKMLVGEASARNALIAVGAAKSEWPWNHIQSVGVNNFRWIVVPMVAIAIAQPRPLSWPRTTV